MSTPFLPAKADLDISVLDKSLFRFPAAPAEPKTTPGSNSFGVGGQLTNTHAALIAGDMHLELRAPNIWFRARLIYPNTRRKGETVDVSGVSLPGVPGIVAGSNRHIAWAFTNSYGDWADWVRLQLDPNDKTRYRSGAGTWEQIQAIDEIIKVHNAADVILSVRQTRWGPILAEDTDGAPLALAWVGAQEGAINAAGLSLDTAESADEGADIGNRAGMPAQNLLVGDKVGNISWTIAGRIPRRLGGYDPLLPSDWSAANTGWNGWIDPEHYPRIGNPAKSRLWTANARTTEMEWLALIGDGGYDFGARARQIRDDLMAKDRFVPDDMLAIQLDDRAVLMEHWKELLQQTLTAAGDQSLGEMVRIVSDWPGHADPKSASYRLVREFRTEVINSISDGFAAAVRAKFPDFTMPRLPQAETLVQALLLLRPPHLLPPRYKDWNDLLLQCAQRVAQRLGQLPGGLAARTWGEFNATRIRHPLSRNLPGLGAFLDMPREELPGDAFMPRVQGPSFGASQRFAVEPGHEEFGYMEMPGGQSDHPLSPFHGAGHADWAQGKPTPFLPGPTKYTLRIIP
jgi:penicillin G amidase